MVTGSRLFNSRRTRALATSAGAFLLLGCAAAGAAEPEARGTTATVPISADLHARILSGAGGASAAYILHIDGVQLPANQPAANQPAVIHVFGNLPEIVDLEHLEDSPHYLGDFTIVPRTAGSDGPAEKTEIALDVTASLPVLLKNSRTLTVTLIPAGGYRPDKDLKLRFEKIYVMEEE